MGKISITTDLMKLAGAQIVKSTKTGQDLLVFNLDDGSTRLKKFGRRDGSMGVDCKLDVIPNTKPNEYNEDTHWLAQQTTKEERAAGLKLPSVGSGREWPDRESAPQGQHQMQQRQHPPQRQQQTAQPRQGYQQPAPRQNAPQQGQQRQYTPPPHTKEQPLADGEEHSWGDDDNIPGEPF